MKRVHGDRIRLILVFAVCVLAGCKGGGGGGNNVGSGTPSPTLQSIQVSPANSSTPLGRTQQFTAKGLLSNGSTQDLTSTVAWISSAPAVATINNTGLGSSKAQGTTIIQASSSGISGSVAWSVTAPALASIAISPASASIPRGTNQQFTATGTFTDGSTQDLTNLVEWVSSSSTLSVNSAGLAIGVKTGDAMITAALGAVSGSTSVTVILPSPRFAYVANRNDSSISIYAVDSASGQMRANGYVLTGGVIGGAQAFSVTVDPMGKFAYVTDGSLSVFGFTINASTGALTAVPGSPFAVGAAPVSVRVDPSGRFVYVASTNSSTVSAFTINPNTGALTPVPGSPFPAGIGPISVIVDPSGRFLYVSDSSSSEGVSAFTISQSTGFLTAIPGSPFATGIGPGPVAVDPTGRFAYIPNFNSNTISTLTINAEHRGLDGARVASRRGK